MLLYTTPHGYFKKIFYDFVSKYNIVGIDMTCMISLTEKYEIYRIVQINSNESVVTLSKTIFGCFLCLKTELPNKIAS